MGKACSLDIKQSIVLEAKKLLQPDETIVRSGNTNKHTEIDFFQFLDESENCITAMDRLIELQVLQFLQEPDNDLLMLKTYPYVEKVFTKFNTPLSSSAQVERLFSYATFIDSPRRHALSDENFERLVLMKANKLT